MIVRGLTENQIRDGVGDTPNAMVQYIDRHGKGFRVKLSVNSTKDGERYYRTSASGFRPNHKVSALCWHGFRHVMRNWFLINSDTVIITGQARYNGSVHFELVHGATGDKNIGSRAYPMRYRDACNCDSLDNAPIHFADLHHDNGQTYETNVRYISQNSIKRCPHFIMVPEHYRPDETCKCNDKNETVMGEWGYRWNDKKGIWVS